MKMESAGKDMRRIVSDTGEVVGLAAKLMNNRWCALDCDGGRISRAGFFDTPRQVLQWFEKEER